MKTALNRKKGRAEDDGGMFNKLAEKALLATPEGVAMRARVDAATTEFYPARDEHVRQITLLCLRAKGV